MIYCIGQIINTQKNEQLCECALVNIYLFVCLTIYLLIVVFYYPSIHLPHPAGMSMSDTPCMSINRALGNTPCNASCISSDDHLENVTIRLTDGTHRLTGCVGIVGGRNVAVEAENLGGATITCETFPNLIPNNFDNLFVCGTSGITFRGVRFEGCGPVSPNVFLNASSDVLFHECTFQ